MRNDLPVWRSLLYVPVNVEKFVDKAHTRGADVIQLDLEDAVPPAEKEKARTLVEKNAARVRRGGADVVVRINQPLALAVRDLEHSVCPDVDAIPPVCPADSRADRAPVQGCCRFDPEEARWFDLPAPRRYRPM